MRIIFLILSLLVSCQYMVGNDSGRQKTEINANWKFRSNILTNDPAATGYNDNDWPTVNIPHCWNATDAQDGGGNYLRTVGWYRKNIAWDNSWQDKKLYLELQGASLQAECFVNGVSVGHHKGGYTAFRVDITPQMKTGNNLIAIKVDNRQSEEIMPLGGGFSFMGGIYRNIFLIVANEVRVDLMDNGSPGLYLTTTDVSNTKADLEIKANIVNNASVAKTVTIEGILRNPDHFEAIADVPNPAFDISTMHPGGAPVKSVSRTITIPAGTSYEFKEKVTVENPRLWNGKKDPYRYLVDLQVKENGNLVDAVSEYVGFRYFSVTKEGFFLNGNLYPLRGVNRHQDRYNMGYAITTKEHNEDFGMIYDIGANTVRFAHYPHDSYIYDLCDRYGLVVWAEIPLVDRPGTAGTFNEVTKDQLRELIRQQYNRPSICFWGLQNEIRTHHDDHMKVLMKELNDLAHAEDPSRLTVQASNHTTARNWDSDVFAWNYYPGWYVENPLFGPKLDDFKANEPLPTALSEYGAGGSIYHHEINPSKPVTNGGKFHPEEYQNKVHEQAIRDFSTRDFVWGTFLWNMFDFASDSRNEGDQAGMNNKGLVTYDRKVKKDSYFAYKANWSNEPVIYISSRRYTERKENITPVTVYSNCESVELFVNGTSMGKKSYQDVECGFFKWEETALVSGENTVKVVGIKDQKEYTDEIVWNKIAGTSTDLSSGEWVIDNNNKQIVLKGNIPAEDIHSYLQGVDGATFVLVGPDGTTPVTEGFVTFGMKVVVTSEDGKNKVVYEFISGSIALNKVIITDSEEKDNYVYYAIDGDFTTRWAAADRDPHWVEIDLGKEYLLNRIKIQWFNPNGTRAYQYYVKTAGEDKNYRTEVDRSTNTLSDNVADNLSGKSRFVKIDITGSNATTAYASLYEIEVYGWRMESEEYTIDFDNKKIIIPGTEENKTNLPVDKFLGNISFDGNLSYNLTSISYFIQENDELIITDYSGNKTPFTLVFSEELNIAQNPKEGTRLFRLSSQKNNVYITLAKQIDSATLQIRDLPGRTIVSGQIKDVYSCYLDKGIYLINVYNKAVGNEVVKYLVK